MIPRVATQAARRRDDDNLEGMKHPYLLINNALPRANKTGIANDEQTGLKMYLSNIETRTRKDVIGGRLYFIRTW